MALDGINGGNEYPKGYLDAIENETFKRIDKERGNDDEKIQINEVLTDLNIPSLLSGQSQKDAAKLSKLTQNLPEILAKYAGDDGVFSAQEFADFINGAEWSAVMDAWHASTGKAKMEMQWIDAAQTSFHDGHVTKVEVKAGILNDLAYQGIDVDTQQIEALIDKYAGEDGTFTLEEYQKMKQDPKYKAFIEQYNVAPWFDPFENSDENNTGFKHTA